jgi:tetratricopeptide (TPR) repeat protein
MKKSLLMMLLVAATVEVSAQFHTLKIPQPSNQVTETQTLAVTDITIDYSSPSANGRDVWNDTNVIPKNGNPIAWRAGANMNTTIEFSTDVTIEGEPLKAGKYGFHIIPKDGSYQLLFAHNNDQWGSYYLDVDKDVTLKVDVKSEECPASEKLDYEFINWTESTVQIALEWANRRIPFTVGVDLNNTVVESFRSELRGINTYHWQAWNDAAAWCLRHNTNLEEALTWADRSINGGYGGFAADKNVTNMTTKARILKALNKSEALTATINELKSMSLSPYEANGLGIFLLQTNKAKDALEITERILKDNPDVWFLKLNKGICQYYLGNKKAAIKALGEVEKVAPEGFKPRLGQIKTEIQNDTYKVPGS